MKKFLLILTSIYFALSASAQIETVFLNGKMHYVYPYQAEVQNYSRQYMRYVDSKEILIRDSKNQKVVSTEYEAIEHSAKIIKEGKKMDPEFIKRMETDFSLMSDLRVDLDKDITPTLEKLPDGMYVQYFRDVPYIKDRVLKYKNDIVAGVFSVKNNQLDGESIWYAVDGSIIKKGKYFNGSKFGVWNSFYYEENYEKSNIKATSVGKEKLDDSDFDWVYDTVREVVEFKNGIRDGVYARLINKDTLESGSYYQNTEANTWRIYAYKEAKEKDDEGMLYWKPTNELILIKKYTVNTNGESRAKSRMFRELTTHEEYNDYGYYYEDEYFIEPEHKYFLRDTMLNGYYETNFPDFTSYYAVEISKENLDLPSEEYHSFEGGEGEEYYYDNYRGEYYDDYVNEEDLSDSALYNRINENDITVRIDGKRFLMNKVIDSIGYHFHYEGEIVEYHKNGQLKYRYEIDKTGKLVEESPVYFDNGQIANKISFDADSNLYKQEFFDYYGQLYKTIRYDINGKALFEKVVDIMDQTVAIDGLEYEINWGGSTLDYTAGKEVRKGIEEKKVIHQELWKYNRKIAAQTYFDPNSKLYTSTDFTLGNKVYKYTEITFGEDYSSLSGSMKTTFKNLESNLLFSGAYEKDYLFGFYGGEEDTTVSPQSRILRWQRYYDIDQDFTLKVDNQPFTGKVEGRCYTPKFKFKATDKSIVIHVPNPKADLKAYNSTLKAYSKGKETPLLDAYVPAFGEGDQFTETPTKLIPELSFLKVYNGESNYSLDTAFNKERSYEMESIVTYKKSQLKQRRSIPVYASGLYYNGKSNGPWVVKNQFNHPVMQFSYKDGELEGDYIYTDQALPERKPSRKELKKYRSGEYNYESYNRRENQIPREYRDSLPSKPTYYTRYTVNFTKGKASGWSTEYNWLGDTVAGTQLLDGRKNGLSYTRNKLIYSESYFEDGVEDGLTRAWITPIGKDSILLYELNYQNGALQGKSVTYHTNGRIAKKGFFLTGQPIDDYEAYDTLGNLYQFVKFQFNQPIQEKIWEENELSVLYEFDWKDSVDFNVGDIISASSTSRYMQDLGFRDGSVYAPYMGRPSVLDKEGVNYKMTKYYPNDTVARTGQVAKGKKVGIWNYYNYYGTKLVTVNYFDSIIKVNDTLKFSSKGILTYLDPKGNELSKSWIIEKFEKYDCAHTDHNEERLLYCFWEKDTAQHRINGYTKNYYDNGSIQNEGMVKNGLPVGIWKMYDVDGRLSQVGTYNNGKRNGRWLSGDLGDVKNMSEICLNPNLENLDEILQYQENLLDISVVYYQNGKEIRREYYGINKNNGEAPEGFEGDEYYDYYQYYDGE